MKRLLLIPAASMALAILFSTAGFALDEGTPTTNISTGQSQQVAGAAAPVASVAAPVEMNPATQVKHRRFLRAINPINWFRRDEEKKADLEKSPTETDLEQPKPKTQAE